MNDLGKPLFGQHPTLASAWVEAALAGTAAWTAWYTAATALGTLANQRSDGGAYGSRRSWYRPPAETTDWLTAWLPGLRASGTAFDWWRVGTNVPSAWPAPHSHGFDIMRFWLTAMTALSMPMMSRIFAPVPPSPGQQWLQLALTWPLSAAPRVETPTPFAFYRSDGGHAMAQIMVPEMVAAAALWPAFSYPYWRTV